MSTLLVAVLIASLLGSLHCVGMCGPFVAFATLRVRREPRVTTPSLSLQLAYHGGRLLSYALLGAIAGQLGATLDLGSTVLGWGRVAGIAAGAFLMLVGFGRILSLAGVRLPTAVDSAWLARRIGAAQVAANCLTPTARAWVMGLLTTLLPCGWLYAFVAVAAGTSHAYRGALVMLVFWMGTVPALASVGAGLGVVLREARQSIQVVIAVIVIGLGLHSVLGRWDFPIRRIASPTSSIDAAIERASRLLERGSQPCH